MIEIDGSQGEGGGQILRTALALSLCTGRPVRLANIRARRPRPGLMRQHLACVKAAEAVSGARVEGAEPGAQTLVFEPGPVRAGEHEFKVGSAGSCTLVLQTLWPALLRAGAPSRVAVEGGTHNPMAPPFHFIARSFAPLVRRLGGGVELQLQRLGFYPAGGGRIEAGFYPAAEGLRPFDLPARGERRAAFAESLVPGIPAKVAVRELEALGRALGWSGEQLRTPAVRQNEGPGNALMATLEHAHVTEVFTSFGEKTVSAEQVARALALEVRRYLRGGSAALGPYLADQWALPLALAVTDSGRAAHYSCTELTAHAHSNFAVIERFLPLRFATRARAEAEGDGWLVELQPA